MQNTSNAQKNIAFCTLLHTIAGMVIKIGKSGNPHCPFEVRWSEAGKLCRKRFKAKGDAALFAVSFFARLYTSLINASDNSILRFIKPLTLTLAAVIII